MPIARNQILITIDGVKDLSEKGIAFRCRYELVGFTDDGRPAASRGTGALAAEACIRARGVRDLLSLLRPGRPRRP